LIYIKVFDIDLDEQDLIAAEGTERLVTDLGLDPSDVVTIVLSWHLKCPTMCEFSRDGFRKGCKELGISSLNELKSKIPEFERELSIPETLKQIYQFTFQFAKQQGQKSLPLETAIAFWDLLILDFKYLELWKTFLVEKHGKAISKDTWNLFYDFIESFNGFKNHDTDGFMY
jgi:DCN1-like protein 1/2